MKNATLIIVVVSNTSRQDLGVRVRVWKTIRGRIKFVRGD